MENRTSDLWLGLGIGSVIGALVYRFSRTSKAKKLKKKVCDAFHKISGQAEEMLDTAKEKVLDTGAAVADKVADKTFDLAEKSDDLKELERKGLVYIIRPENPVTIGRTERDPEKLQALYDIGRKEGLKHIRNVKNFLGE